MRGKSTGAITVRGLDNDIVMGLEQAAIRHDRTKEGEARAALRAWIQPELSAVDHSIREQGERLSFALQQIQKLFKGRDMTASSIAEQIGEDQASPIVGGFQGEKELTFSQLDKISDFLGVSSEWLKHGTGYPYPFSFMDRISKASDVFGNYEEEEIHKILLIRTNDDTGSLYVLKQYEGKPFSAEVLITRYHISEEIGGGGEGDLCLLFPVIKELYRKHKLKVDSYLIDPVYLRADDYGQNLHPLNIAFHAKPCPWMDDIWDATSKHTKNLEHWPGMIALRTRILSAMESKGISLNRET